MGPQIIQELRGIQSVPSRWKAGWRILLFVLVFMSLSSFIFIVKPLLGDITKREFLSNYSLIIVAILSASATISVYLCRKFIDRMSFSSLGLFLNTQSFKDLGFGFFLSGGMAGLFYLILYGLGFLDVHQVLLHPLNLESLQSEGWTQLISIFSLGTLMILLVEHILVGYWEELVFRGYIFQNLIKGVGIALAISISCMLYGLLHYSNPNATILSSLIIIGFGFLRIYGLLITDMLWLSMGMHIGWNFFQGPIFGFGASGHEMSSLIVHQFSGGPDYLTGGSFGPEGSIIIIPILVLAMWIMRTYARTKRNPQENRRIPMSESILV